MAQAIVIERILEQRDVDAALYLLSRMLGSNSAALRDRAERLLVLKKRLESSRRINPEQRREVIDSYREVIG